MSSSDNNQFHSNENPAIKHSEPIPIGSPNPSHRRRSASLSSSSASSSSPSSPLVQTPLSVNAPRLPGSPSSSPILSYFLAQSPTKTAATFPFKRNFGAPPVFEEEEQEVEVPAAIHARRATTAVAGRFSQQQQPQPPASISDAQRGSGLLRRLSLGGAFNKSAGQGPSVSPPRPPSPPPNTAVSSTAPTFPAFPDPLTRKMRRATLAPDMVGSRPRRAPSPMGERILKGHFDGFN